MTVSEMPSLFNNNILSWDFSALHDLGAFTQVVYSRLTTMLVCTFYFSLQDWYTIEAHIY